MVKKVFFSFHYQDVIDFRANVVRNHFVLKDREDAGFFDRSIWEESKKQGDIALKRMINGALDNTSNTCVLIGSATWNRPWVRYEIMKSFMRGNHLFALHINGVKGKDGLVKPYGANPFEHLGVTYSADGRSMTLWEKVNGKWVKYERIEGKSSFAPVAKPRDGNNQGYNLGQLFPIYDWVKQDGYNNFANWLR